MSNELGRLDSGVVDIMTSGTDTIFFIHKNQVPSGRKAKHANSVYDYRPLKDNYHHVQLTVGGDRLIYPGDPSAPTESLLDSKTIFNSTILTPGAHFFGVDIKYYFLNNPMARYEYMKISLSWFPQDIIDQ